MVKKRSKQLKQEIQKAPWKPQVQESPTMLQVVLLKFFENFDKYLSIFKKQFSLFIKFLMVVSNKISSYEFSKSAFVKLSLFKQRVRKRGRPRKLKPAIGNKYSWFVFGVAFSAIALFIPVVLYSWYKELPSPALLSDSVSKCTKILDRKQRLLYEVCPEKRSEPIIINQVAPILVNATLAIEDDSFYKHSGFDITSTIRAAYQTLVKDNVQGGSTITQQLVKMSLLSSERTLTRKLKELVLSIVTESHYTKDQILELYLNNAPYGGNIVGVETASNKFFGKKAKELSLAEASLLAGLPSAPSVYSPFSSLNLAKDRQRAVLNRMVELKYVSRDEADQAFKEQLTFVDQREYVRAPHFVDFVRSELEKEYGKHFVNFSGLTIVTSLDLDVQDKVQEIVRDQVEANSNLNISNGAAVVLDSRTGEILSMVGSVDYFDVENDGKFNVTVAPRQPGSSIKPVTYALALAKGYKASSLIDDKPIAIGTGNGGEVYRPVNYDGQFHGKVTLRQALANSYNIPAVSVLKSLNIDDMVNLGRKMGLVNWEADGNYGLSITLGGKETRLLDLTNVYATFSRMGSFTSVKPVLVIRDSKGYEIYKYNLEKEQVLDQSVSYIITNILSDNIARVPAFGYNNMLQIPGHSVAVKTGTTDLKRDNYTVGYTPTYSVGVWVGNNDNKPMNQNLASGLTGAAPAWNKIMSFLLVGTQNEEFMVPDSIVVKQFCKGRKEVYIKGTEPKSIECDRDNEDKKKDKKNDTD